MWSALGLISSEHEHMSQQPTLVLIFYARPALQYVPQDVVMQIVRAKAGLAHLSVEEKPLTILFSDIESFTKVSGWRLTNWP